MRGGAYNFAAASEPTADAASISIVPEPQKKQSFLAKLRTRLNRGNAWIKGEIGSLLDRGLDEATLLELEDQLLMADVGLEATASVMARLRRGGHERLGDCDDARELLRDAVRDLLLPLAIPLQIDTARRPFVIVFVGVNGTGKTTSIGKLAHWLNNRGFSVLLAAADTFRAAAVEQLTQWGYRAGVPVVAQSAGADPAAVVHDALEAARARNIDVVIADTAGRLHTSVGLMDELQKIKRVVQRFDPDAPHEVVLVMDASQGQNALEQTKQFNERIGLTGLILTKLDGSAKGGIALAVAQSVPIPIRFIAVGEGIEDFDVFDAADFAAALTGVDQE